MDDSSAEPPPRRDWLELYGRLVPPAVAPRARWAFAAAAPNADADADADADGPGAGPPEISELQRRLPDELLLNVLARLGGADAPYALAPVAAVCRHFRLLASAPALWEKAAWLAFTAPAFQAGLGGQAVGAGEHGEGADGDGGRQRQQQRHQQQQQQQQQAGGVVAVAHAVWAPAAATSAAAAASRQPRPARLPPAPPAAAAFASGPAAVQRLLATRHRGSWRDLYLSTPRPRSDGVYCSRNTYVRQGCRELRSASGSQTCHLVAYFRYWHFLPRTGALVYRTSPLPPTRVARGLKELAAAVERRQAGGGWGGGGGGAGEEDGEGGGGHVQRRAQHSPQPKQQQQWQQPHQQQQQQQQAQQQQQQQQQAQRQQQQQQQAQQQQQQQPQQKQQQQTQHQAQQHQTQQQQQQPALVGRYAVRGTALLCAVAYPGARLRTEIRTRLALRCTVPGAWNRLDVRSIESFDREDGTTAALAGQGGGGGGAEDEEDDEEDALWQAALGTRAAAGVSAEARRAHRRGLNPAVFVPWGEVHTTRLNEPPSRMDVFIPG